MLRLPPLTELITLIVAILSTPLWLLRYAIGWLKERLGW